MLIIYLHAKLKPRAYDSLLRLCGAIAFPIVVVKIVDELIDL